MPPKPPPPPMEKPPPPPKLPLPPPPLAAEMTLCAEFIVFSNASPKKPALAAPACMAMYGL